MNAFIDLSQNQQVLELVSYAGSLLPNGAQFVAAMTPKVNSGAIADVLKELINVSNVFYTTNKEAESVLNSLARLMPVVKPEESSTLTRALAVAISSDKIQGFEQSRLKGLAALFNNIDKDSITRYYTYLELIKFAGRCNMIDALETQFSQIPSWLAQWRCDGAQSRELYHTLSGVLTAPSRVKQFVEFQTKYLATFNGASATELASVEKDVVHLLSTVVCHAEIFKAPELLTLDAVNHLAGKPVHDLFKLMFSADMSVYTAWRDAHQAEFAALGFDAEQVSRKMRLLTLASLCARHSVIDFATISSALQVPADHIEIWIIGVISAGLVEAKIDEVHQKLIVSRSTHTEFGMPQWVELQKKLQAWNTNVQGVQTVLDDVRAQIQEGPKQRQTHH